MCPNCKKSNYIDVNNYRTCTDCGNMYEYVPTYVQSYALPFLYTRKCYYSRIKRFSKALRNMRSDIIGDQTEHILNTYSLIEFGFNMQVKKERKYFFSQKVVLFFILKVLGIDLVVPLLKNKERTYSQLKQMSKILETKFPGY